MGGRQGRNKDLERIFKNSEKGKLIEQLAQDLETIEAYGMLEVAKQDLQEED